MKKVAKKTYVNWSISKTVSSHSCCCGSAGFSFSGGPLRGILAVEGPRAVFELSSSSLLFSVGGVEEEEEGVGVASSRHRDTF